MKVAVVFDIPDDLDIPLDEIKANITVSSKDATKFMLYWKYKDCQLRPLPRKLTEADISWSERRGYRGGWNNCLAEITGEAE